MSDLQPEPTPNNKAMEKRSVVSSFLFKLCDSQAHTTKVALFRRSNKVHTYQHHLAPISGSIDSQTDATPVAAAWRELKEETTLTSPAVKLWRKGRSFSFQDESVGREWTIYPFAFLLKPPAEGGPEAANKVEDSHSDDGDGITFDWEHDFYNWHDPDEVLSRLDQDGANATICGQKLVPRIADSLRNVYPEYHLGSTAGRRLREGLQQLQNDHESGARELATIALNILKDILMEVRPSKAKENENEGKWDAWWRDVRLISWHLWTNGRESMGAAIGSALLSVLADIEKLYEERGSEDEIIRIVDRSIRKREAMTTRFCEALDSYLRDEVVAKGGIEREKKTLRLMTLSASSTIRESILHFLRKNARDISFETLDVRVLESRPLYEGVSLASTLSSSFQSTDDDSTGPKIRVTLFTDNSAALAARDVDVLLIGADRIAGSNGAVSNKTGSLPAILAAKHVSPQVRVLVVSELDKVAQAEAIESHPEEDNDAEEVVRAWRLAGVKGADVIDGVTIKNVYFEWVPAELIDAYITDEGVKGVAGICERSTWVSQQVHRFFDKL
ncbi:translation initiation factor eIF-2B subunit family protein [Talaromyces stipitatus ATCC 10500]|uniref:Translation initiation factor eIF-2B subunit family protein n=1 Tax=Talaromyces stipitatus (strain ATCC 10500 / CBS 375.48 / QM 6759 / NRRL 1006) TaxID=441959 RepID=B8MIB3_TALSN|nr:translation initiation factor eIF-2B subunit family protein [Talaromyces stipitatus ATCC 10500]EED14597.1 translation initiation factor eIF-2B subunit family protein [Talaromyces stipitatus ATCC 10500]